MRQYFALLRVYRPKDGNYWTLKVKLHAESLSGFESVINAFAAGLKVAGAESIGVDSLGIDFPPSMYESGDFETLDSHGVYHALRIFLGLKRVRTTKGEVFTSETQGGQNGS